MSSHCLLDLHGTIVTVRLRDGVIAGDRASRSGGERRLSGGWPAARWPRRWPDLRPASSACRRFLPALSVCLDMSRWTRDARLTLDRCWVSVADAAQHRSHVSPLSLNSKRNNQKKQEHNDNFHVCMVVPSDYCNIDLLPKHDRHELGDN